MMLCILAFALGALFHVAYFRQGEHHLYGLLYLRIALLLPIITTSLLWRFQGFSWAAALRFSLTAESRFLCGLFSSIALYRLSPFHRLHQYPGPLSWRISKLAHAWSNTNFQSYINLHKIHTERGDYVRTGPSELSVIDPDAILAILGTSSRCTRAAWYGMAHPLRAIFHTRSKTEHERRRQAWSQGLSNKALKAYEGRIQSQISRLNQEIEKRASRSEEINVSNWFNYLSFDVMGDVGFGKDFGMLEKGEKLDVLKILENGQKGLGVFGVVPWLFMILTKIPWISKEHDLFVQWCKKQIVDRQKRGSAVQDIASALIEDDKQALDSAISQQWLVGDSRILIVAGSDAVASSLAFAFYYLAQDAKHTEAIRHELTNIDSSGKWDAVALQSRAPYLNAFISEVLRLWPPNPSGVLRQTPKEGLQVEGKHIPGDITICTPFWALHRSPKCFARPFEFIPERWTSCPELILRKEAYVPFGSGSYACIGKQLALMEMRLTIAQLLMHYNISFASEKDRSLILEDSKDWFTWGVADLNLVFRGRRDGVHAGGEVLHRGANSNRGEYLQTNE